jgi:hypothetical protein
MSGDFPVIDIAAVQQPQVSAAARFLARCGGPGGDGRWNHRRPKAVDK